MSGTASHKMPASQRTHKSPQPSGETAGQPKVEEMNLAAVQRVDGRARALVSTVPRVVLYQYENSSNTWVREGREREIEIERIVMEEGREGRKRAKEWSEGREGSQKEKCGSQVNWSLVQLFLCSVFVGANLGRGNPVCLQKVICINNYVCTSTLVIFLCM